MLSQVPETLKNLLLVMGASGAFESKIPVGNSGLTLAALTAGVVEGISADLARSPDLAPLWPDARSAPANAPPAA